MPLTQEQLERHLWGAADILRGRIDSGDYKHYIFGLLFFKRLSDVWWEEYDDRLARYEGDGREFPNPRPFSASVRGFTIAAVATITRSLPAARVVDYFWFRPPLRSRDG